MKKRLPLLISGITAFYLFGCGAMTTAPQRRMEQDLAALQSKIPELEKDYNAKINYLEDSIKKIEEKIKNTEDTFLTNQAKADNYIETIRSDFRKAEGQIEEIAHKTEITLKESKKKIEDYEFQLRNLELKVAELLGKINTLENNQKLFTELFSTAPRPTAPELKSIIDDGGDKSVPVEAAEEKTAGEKTAEDKKVSEEELALKSIADDQPGKASPPAATAEAAAAALTDEAAIEEEIKIPQEAQVAYDNALGLFNDEKYDDARNAFAKFLVQYPDVGLADNAQFWIADCHFKKKEFDKAIVEYDKMITTYPESGKIPSALVKEGFAFLELGYNDEAKSTFRKLISAYPDTKQAEIARRRLKIIK